MIKPTQHTADSPHLPSSSTPTQSLLSSSIYFGTQASSHLIISRIPPALVPWEWRLHTRSCKGQHTYPRLTRSNSAEKVCSSPTERITNTSISTRSPTQLTYLSHLPASPPLPPSHYARRLGRVVVSSTSKERYSTELEQRHHNTRPNRPTVQPSCQRLGSIACVCVRTSVQN